MEEGKTFILKAVVARGSTEQLVLLRIPLAPSAHKINAVNVIPFDLTGQALADKVLVSGKVHVDGIYVDGTGQVRSLQECESVNAVIPLSEVRPAMHVSVTALVEDTVAELTSPCEALVKAALKLSVLVTEHVPTKHPFGLAHRVTIARRSFFNLEEEYITADAFTPSQKRDCSKVRTTTYFLHNVGASNVAEVYFEGSPDGILWQRDGGIRLIAPLQNSLYTPLYLLHFVRLRFRSAVPGQPTTIHIWFQGQA